MGLPLRGWVVTGILTLSSTGALAADSKVSFPPCTTAPTESEADQALRLAAGQVRSTGSCHGHHPLARRTGATAPRTCS
jgi:hypothetical protein